MYRIIKTPHYYTGTFNAPQEGYVLDEDDEGGVSYYQEPLEFETVTEAEAWIKEEQSGGTYYLGHGEASRPSYKIIDMNNLPDEDDCLDATVYGDVYLDATAVDYEDIPASIQHKLDSLDVEYSYSGDTYDVYVGEVDDYIVIYCPRTVALEDNKDDLGMLDWDHAAYYKITEED